MNIGYDAKRAFNNPTGLGNYSRMLISSMLQHHPEHQYHLYTPKIADHQSSFAALINEDVNAQIHLPTAVTHRVFKSYWRSFGIRSAINKQKLNIYHGLSHELPRGIDIPGCKRVVTVHDLINLRFPEFYPRIDRFFYQSKLKRACQEADAIVAISEQTSEDIQSFLGIPAQKIKVIYQDALPAFRHPVQKEALEMIPQLVSPSNEFILVVGSFEVRKNHEKILRSYAQLPSDRPLLVFVGRKNKYWRQIEKTIHDLKLTSEIIVLEDVSTELLKALYQKAIFSIYVSLFEGFGLPVLESLTQQTPVLASNNSCLEEVGGDACLYVNPKDVEAMAMAMRSMLYDQLLYRNLKERAKDNANKFSFEKMSNELNDLYLSL